MAGLRLNEFDAEMHKVPPDSKNKYARPDAFGLSLRLA
jgi:hypothetical protein